MKYLLTIIAILSCLSSDAQRRFRIEPYIMQTTVTTNDTFFIERSDTATQVSLTVSNIGKDTCVVQFVLYKNDSVSAIRGAFRPIGNAAAAIILARPINLTNLNNFILRRFGVTALSEY